MGLPPTSLKLAMPLETESSLRRKFMTASMLTFQRSTKSRPTKWSTRSGQWLTLTEVERFLRKNSLLPSDIIDACDSNGSGGISKEEAHACIDAHITDPDENAQAHEMVDAGFDHVDKNGDGEIDEHELSKAMRDHKKGSKLMQTLQGPPSPAEVMEECDKNGDNELTKKEVKACIKKHVPPEYEEHVDEAVDHVWPMVDTDGSGKVDMKELEAAMKNM